MGVPIQQIVEEIKHGSPHLRIILPAAAAILWTIRKLTGHKEEPEEGESSHEETGKVVEIGFSKGKAPKLPYKSPEKKRTVLLDVVVKTSIREFWNDMLSSSSTMLKDFHARMNDKDIYLGSWREQVDGSKTRLLKFIKPLKNPLGPKQAFNYESFNLVDMSSNGFVVEAVCSTEGVPFSSSFENHLQWAVSYEDARLTRVIISGECNFTARVLGPLKGTISRESIKGMGHAYDTFGKILSEKYGLEQTLPDDDEEEEESLGKPLTQSFQFSGLAHTAQTNPAVLVALLATMIILWRIIMTQTIYHAMLRRLAQQVLQ